jgi:hypothetical protein
MPRDLHEELLRKRTTLLDRPSTGDMANTVIARLLSSHGESDGTCSSMDRSLGCDARNPGPFDDVWFAGGTVSAQNARGMTERELVKALDALDGHESDAEGRGLLAQHNRRIEVHRRIWDEVLTRRTLEEHVAAYPSFIGTDEALRRLRDLARAYLRAT